MEQRDFVKRQIDQLGKILGRMLSDLLGLKQSEQAIESIETINQTLNNELGFDIEEVVAIPTDKFINTFVQKGFNNENLEKLADILFIIADSMQQHENDKRKLYERCLIIYGHLEKSETIYSFDRHLKIERIKNILF